MPSSPTPPSPSPLHRVAVALDTDDRETFRRWCGFFGPRVGVLKVGLEAFVRWGPPAVEEARRHGRAVFLDLKLHDIPHTVAGAVASARSLGVRLLTVHAGGGPPMLQAASEAAGSDLQLLAVTLLTHLDGPTLDALDLAGPPETRVRTWATLARDAGCSGAVCSPRELSALRPALSPPFLLVTPGIRPAGHAADDQRRTATPRAALESGANLLVIGRPLTRAADPGRALAELESELSGVAGA